MDLEEKVRNYIKDEAINPNFIAKLLGLSIIKLNSLLQGKRKMKADELIILCEYYGLDLSFFKSRERSGI